MPSAESAVAVRRIPKQKRSRERYERILTSARLLIAERGNDGVSMREIADHCAVPIASVYQYFPDKNALLWTLISGDFERIEQEWRQRLGEVDSMDSLLAASVWLFDAFVTLCRNDPSFVGLWGSAQANKVLMALDYALNERIAEGFVAKLEDLHQLSSGEPLSPEVAERTRAASRLMTHLSSTALQLAFGKDAVEEQLLEEFRALIRLQFSQLG